MISYIAYSLHSHDKPVVHRLCLGLGFVALFTDTIMQTCRKVENTDRFLVMQSRLYLSLIFTCCSTQSKPTEMYSPVDGWQCCSACRGGCRAQTSLHSSNLFRLALQHLLLVLAADLQILHSLDLLLHVTLKAQIAHHMTLD